MASFTDQLLPYTPYVAQLPVNAMKEVGMYKQQQYNEGVQKIQSQVDDIAGLDVVRDVDKQYLQSRLNELGSNLKKVAAGDFSNFQLVNSVGGMTKQIVKDPNIQNAVASTMKYRKGLADMESAKKEGKSSPSNEWDFQTQASNWLNNKDIKSGFSGGYNPYTNYKKNALDTIKALTKDESITDDAFTLDSKGNLVIADAIVRKKLAGIDPGKIQQALMATLSPADFKQMEIDGRYTYSNVSPEQFSQNLKSSYRTKVDFYNEQKRILENAKSSTTSVLQKSKLDEQIASLEKVLGGISGEQKQMDDALAHGNIEGVKAQLHTSNFLNNFSKAFSYTETSNTYETNPFAKAQQWREEQARDWDKFQKTYELRKREVDIQASKLKLDSGYGGLPQPSNQENLPKVNIASVVDKTQEYANSLSSLDNGFLGKKGKNEEWLNQQREAWTRSPNGVESEVAYHLASTEPLRRITEANKAMLISTQKEAGKALGIGDPSEYINKLIPKNAPDIQYNDGVNQYIYSPKDFVNYNNNLSKYISSLNTGGVAFDFNKAKQELSPKEYHLLEVQASKKPLNEANKILLNNVQHYNQIVNNPNREMIGKINDLSQEELKNRITSPQGMEYTVPTENEAQIRSMGGNLAGLANLAEKTNGKLPGSPDFDVDVARKLSSSPNTQYRLNVVEGSEFQPAMYELTASGKVGDKDLVTKALITPEHKLSMFGQRFEADPRVQAIRPYQEQIRKMGGYSTALSPGESTHNNSFLSSVDFPNVGTYGVKANIIQPAGDLYQIKLSIFDPTQKVWHENISYPSKMISEKALYDALIGLNDSAIYELLNETPSTENDLKQVKLASKKPF
jgi:nitrogen regulatory protein PII-like uncharacterized protein